MNLNETILNVLQGSKIPIIESTGQKNILVIDYDGSVTGPLNIKVVNKDKIIYDGETFHNFSGEIVKIPKLGKVIKFNQNVKPNGLMFFIDLKFEKMMIFIDKMTNNSKININKCAWVNSAGELQFRY